MTSTARGLRRAQAQPGQARGAEWRVVDAVSFVCGLHECGFTRAVSSLEGRRVDATHYGRVPRFGGGARSVARSGAYVSAAWPNES